MTANSNKIEYEFIESQENWDLKKLYIDLAAAKKKALTPVEKTLLRGLLCGYSPAEIANTLYQSRSSNTVRVYLSNGLYKYIEEALSCQTGNTVKIQNWSRVTQLLEKAGYKNSVLKQQSSHSLITPLPKETNSIAAKSKSDVSGTREKLSTGLEEQYPPHRLPQDWGEAIDVSIFHGRTKELQLLEQWIVKERCRLVSLLGMGGIGKTALSVKLAEQIQGQFDYVIWRSLLHAPPFESILAQLLQVLSIQTEAVDSKSQLISYLRSSRCLIVLDHAESLFCSGGRGQYREGYESYGELIKQIGDCQHQSCLVLTSREMPKEISAMQGKTLPVRTLRLTGLTDIESTLILKSQGLSASSQDEWRLLTQCYAGNPFFIKVVGTAIQDLFGGSITNFLKQGIVVFGDIREILDQQFNRLSNLEKQIMCWITLNKELVASRLQKEIPLSVSQRDIFEALESLQRRSLIAGDFSRFYQEPVVVEYILEQLIKQNSKKSDEEVELWMSNPIMETQLKNYIRERRLTAEI